MKNGKEEHLKLGETIWPDNKPEFKKWVKELGISQASYELGEGKARAEEIMKGVGLKPEVGFWELFWGIE